jgi:hypothetical protein
MCGITDEAGGQPWAGGGVTSLARSLLAFGLEVAARVVDGEPVEAVAIRRRDDGNMWIIEAQHTTGYARGYCLMPSSDAT